MAVRGLDDRSFDAYVAEAAVVGFVHARGAASDDVRSILATLAAVHPRVGFATVDVDSFPQLARRFEIDRAPAVILFDDYRSCGRLSDPIGYDDLAALIALRLS